MNKLFRISLIALLLLGLSGIAYGAGIPMASDPLNAPEVWTMEVYNNSGSALTSGSVVVWDNEADSTDTSFAYRTMWINTTTTADDIQVAGVVIDPSIPASSEGTIAIWGPVYAIVADSSDAVTAYDLVGTYTTAGYCGDFAGGGADNGTLGYCILASPVATTLGGYGGSDGTDHIMLPIFVDPVRFSDD